MQLAIEAVRAVEAVQLAKKRIPENLSHRTFFSGYDLWQYNLNPLLEGRHCVTCEEHGDMTILPGNVLRLLFPNLTVVDEDHIDVNEHPNCLCYLLRFSEYERIISDKPLTIMVLGDFF